MKRPRTSRALYLLLWVAGLAWAGITYVDFLHALGQRESSLRPGVISRSGYAGLFQFGEAALRDVGVYKGDATPKTNDWRGGFTGKDGVNSLTDFLANPDAQIRAVTAYHAAAWSTLVGTYGADRFLGTTINGLEITQSGLVAAAHLLGAGRVGEWLESGGTTDPADGNGTRLTNYLSTFAGFALSTSAPTYAALLSADPDGAPAGGHYLYTNPPLRSFASGAGSASLLSTHNSYRFTTTLQAFRSATGFQMRDIRDLLVELTAAAVLTWMAYIVLSKWRAFNAGAETTRDVTFDLLRAMVVTTVVLLLLV